MKAMRELGRPFRACQGRVVGDFNRKSRAAATVTCGQGIDFKSGLESGPLGAENVRDT